MRKVNCIKNSIFIYSFSYFILRKESRRAKTIAELILASDSSQRKINELSLQRTFSLTLCEVNFKSWGKKKMYGNHGKAFNLNIYQEI